MPLVSQRQKNVHHVVERRSIVLFLSAEKEYGLETEKIKEVVYTNEIVPLLGTPSYIEGMMRLHGVMVPVLHLGKRLGLNDAGSSFSDHVVIIEISGKPYGIMVDQVREVLEVDQKQIDRGEGVPGQDLPHLRGVLHLCGQHVPIVDIKQYWSESERTPVLKALNALSPDRSECGGAEQEGFGAD
ncbi:MAG: chemotaxis protein CheW [Nitrospiria bacterium]